MATEQTCRQLRAYRKKLSSGGEVVNGDVLAVLGEELRLTAKVVGERSAAAAATGRSRGGGGRGSGSGQEKQGVGLGLVGLGLGGHGKAVSESVLSGLLDQYSERLVSLLDEKLRLRLSEEDGGGPLKEGLGRERERPRTAGEISEVSGSVASSGSGGVLCEEPESVDGDGRT